MLSVRMDVFWEWVVYSYGCGGGRGAVATGNSPQGDLYESTVG